MKIKHPHTATTISKLNDREPIVKTKVCGLEVMVNGVAGNNTVITAQ